VKRSTDRILTTHVGSLPRPKDLVELYRENAPDSRLLPCLRSAVAEVVQQQARCGIDVINDGEFGKAMRRSVDFGAWWSYIYDRIAGFELREEEAKKGRAARGRPGPAWTGYQPCPTGRQSHSRNVVERGGRSKAVGAAARAGA
jgi:5-methyltetrahydropteroyltriglutamate--homocysteine methyltransferase